MPRKNASIAFILCYALLRSEFEKADVWHFFPVRYGSIRLKGVDVLCQRLSRQAMLNLIF